MTTPGAKIDRSKHSGAGYGQGGYCSICDTDIVRDVNRRIREGHTMAAIMRWAETKGIVHHKTTWYRHKEHMQSGRDIVVQKAKTVREMDKMTRVTNTDFLEAVRDIGYQNAVENPDTVTLGHALKAVSIMESRKDRGRDFLLVIAQAMTGQLPQLDAPTEEGEYEEIE